MSQSEFDIIDKYFRDSGLCFEGRGIDLAIGDDCALLSLHDKEQLAMSMDLLQEGVHFPIGAVPELLGQRALGVNLSDLAAMGAEPMCFTLGLSVPDADDAWLEAFSAGLLKVAERFKCPLVGGDLIRGALNIAIQVQGRLPKGEALLRRGARPGHLVYVTGTLGDAAAALALFDSLDKSNQSSAVESPLLETRMAARHRDHLINSFYCPEPRVAVGMAVRGLASAAIDLSDGLLSDLGHIVQASGVGAELDIAQLPLSEAMRECVVEKHRATLALSGGDDYELCITVPPDHCRAVEKAVASLDVKLTRIGEIVTGDGVQCLDNHGEPVAIGHSGYTHFSEDDL
jgi:thiamine-monophosphate kinase